jgi:hypothetical protein
MSTAIFIVLCEKSNEVASLPSYKLCLALGVEAILLHKLNQDSQSRLELD